MFLFYEQVDLNETDSDFYKSRLLNIYFRIISRKIGKETKLSSKLIG